MIPEQKTFAIPEDIELGEACRGLDRAFVEGWRITAALPAKTGTIVILNRQAVPFQDLNDLMPKEQIST